MRTYDLGEVSTELIRFQSFVRISRQLASNCSNACPSTPAAFRWIGIACYASYTQRFSIWNGLFITCIEILCCQLNRSCNPRPTPLLQPHYGVWSLVRVGRQCSHIQCSHTRGSVAIFSPCHRATSVSGISRLHPLHPVTFLSPPAATASHQAPDQVCPQVEMDCTWFRRR